MIQENPPQVIRDVEQVLADPGLSSELRGFWSAVLAEARRANQSPVQEDEPPGRASDRRVI